MNFQRLGHLTLVKKKQQQFLLTFYGPGTLFARICIPDGVIRLMPKLPMMLEVKHSQMDRTILHFTTHALPSSVGGAKPLIHINQSKWLTNVFGIKSNERYRSGASVSSIGLNETKALFLLHFLFRKPIRKNL